MVSRIDSAEFSIVISFMIYYKKIIINWEVTMQIDSAALYITLKQMKTKLISAQVRQIHQIDNRIMDIEFYCPDGYSVNLIINTYNPPLMYLSSRGKKNKQYSNSQTFCMTLRKYLEGSRLSDIEQIGMDRIACFSFDRIEASGAIITRKLYVELLPASPNIILVQNDIIIDACLRGKKQNRLLISGQSYEYPDNSSRMNFMNFTEDELKNIFDYSKDKNIELDSWLFSQFNGFSRFLIDELLFKCNLSKNVKLSELTVEMRDQVISVIVSMANAISNSEHLYVRRNEKGNIMVFPYPVSFLNSELKEVSPLSFIESEAESGTGIITKEVQEYQKRIHSLVKKEKRKKDKITNEMNETAQMDKYRLWGTLLSIYADKKINHHSTIVLPNIFETPAVDESIPVDPLYSIIENSQQYFKKYNKMKTRISIGQTKLDECDMKLSFLQDMLYFSNEVKTKEELESLRKELSQIDHNKNAQNQLNRKKKPHKENVPQLKTRIIDGFKVYIGTNHTKNAYLTFNKAKKEDIWFHAKAISGSHVVLETDNQKVPESTIEKTAALAAYYSQGKESGKVAVDYTMIRYVKKIPDSLPGHVNYTHQKTIMVHPVDIKE